MYLPVIRAPAEVGLVVGRPSPEQTPCCSNVNAKSSQLLETVYLLISNSGLLRKLIVCKTDNVVKNCNVCDKLNKIIKKNHKLEKNV